MTEMAKFLNIKTTQKKDDLIKCIFKQHEEKEKLQTIFSVHTELRPFIRNNNTVPRLLNCMMKNSDKLAISRLVATRYDLQSRTTNENNPIYEEACIAFNDYSIPTGGLISNHQAYIEKNINPDLPNLSGLLTSTIRTISIRR